MKPDVWNKTVSILGKSNMKQQIQMPLLTDPTACMGHVSSVPRSQLQLSRAVRSHLPEKKTYDDDLLNAYKGVRIKIDLEGQ